ncbi:MAG: hypothetical protein IPO94_16975 [Saprospiraceae bacterium]|nr:hypothetical protein [Saprospiraceae bacterium]
MKPIIVISNTKTTAIDNDLRIFPINIRISLLNFGYLGKFLFPTSAY